MGEEKKNQWYGLKPKWVPEWVSITFVVFVAFTLLMLFYGESSYLKTSEYDKQIRTEVINEYYNKINEKLKTDTNLKDTIREIHDNVAREMYCKGIDDFANYLVEQGILGNRCISDGEITDYGKVYAKKYKEQLKAGDKE